MKRPFIFKHIKLIKSGSRKNDEIVFIVDNKGIDSAFFIIKNILKSKHNNFVLLIYLLNKAQNNLFKDELLYLEKRYCTKLSVHFCKSINKLFAKTKYLEIIINCQISKCQDFAIIGCPDFVELIIDKLNYLSINQNRIFIHKIEN